MANKNTPGYPETAVSRFIAYLRRRKMSHRTINAYVSDVTSFLQTKGQGQIPDVSSLMAVQAKDLEDYLQGLARSGLNYASVRRASCALKNFFLFLLDQGVVSGNPAALVTVRPTKQLRHSPDQILSIFGYLARKQSSAEDSDIVRYQRDELILLLMTFYGVPQYRLCELKLSSIEASRKHVSLVFSTKSTIQLHLTVLRKLRTYLERRKSNSEFIFLESFSEEPIHRRTIRQALNELNAALHLNCTSNSLRDTCAHLQQHPEIREALIRQVLTHGSMHEFGGSANA
jgi:site-specific recombinase XerD